MQTTDWVLQRIYGCPDIAGDADGYGIQVLDVNSVVQNVNLDRNMAYLLQPKMNTTDGDDGYFAVLDAWNDVDPVGDSNDPVVTDATGVIIRHEEDVRIITNNIRHVLSVKMPDASGTTMSLRVVRLQPGGVKTE